MPANYKGNIHSVFIGDLPKHLIGSNKGKLNREKSGILLGWSRAEVSKAYSNWILIFRMPGSSLLFSSYIKKMLDAGIRPFDVGNKIYQYNLSRFNDDGPYTEFSCRFLYALENLREQKQQKTVYEKVVQKYGESVAKFLQRKNGRLGGVKNRGKTVPQERRERISRTLRMRKIIHGRPTEQAADS